MDNTAMRKMLIAVVGVLIGVLCLTVDSEARRWGNGKVGGTAFVYYGVTTSYTPADRYGNNRYISSDGGGGSVTVGGSAVGNRSSKTYYANTSNIDVVVTPASGYKIASIRTITIQAGQSDLVTYEDITTPPTSATTYQISLRKLAQIIILVDFDASATYTLSYSIAGTDTPSGSLCASTGHVSPASPVTLPAGNSGQTFTITNTNPSCQVGNVNFCPGGNCGGYSTDGLVGNSYTSPNITANSSFMVQFRESSYTVATSVDPTGAPNCGTILPGTQLYLSGATQIFNVTKNLGCAVDSLTLDGSAVTLSGSSTYTLSNITANHSLIVKYSKVATTLGASYCQVPPFLVGQSALKPNLLIIFDTSGSMRDNPYANKSYTCTYTGSTSTLAGCSNFYGYFEKDKMYKYAPGSTTKYLIDTVTPLNLASPNGSGPGRGFSGNYLNFKLMHKVDILRKILIGGQVDPAVGSARNSATGGTNTRFLSTDSNKWVEYGTSDPTGLVHESVDWVRIGLMVFNDNYGDGTLDDDGGVISVPIDTNDPLNNTVLNALVDGIESSDTDPSGNTPLAESLYESLRYFQGGTSAYNTYDGSSRVTYNGTTTDSLDPTHVFANPVQASCQKNFVLLITDGQPTQDGNVPTNTGTNVTDSNLTTWWNSVKTATPHPTTLLGQVAYYAHTHSLKTPTSAVATTLNNLQNLNIYTVFSFGDTTGATYLQDAAKYGAFKEDSTVTGSNLNGKPDVSAEYITTPSDPTTTIGYYEADDGDSVNESVKAALWNIKLSTASGTAAAVANNKSGERGANMIQALFYPEWPGDTVKWLGDIQALWFYISPSMNNTTIYEDTDGNKELNPLIDKVPPTDSLSTKALWRAGAQLQQTAASSRKIYTLLDSSSALSAAANQFTSANVSTLKQTSLMNVASMTDTQAGTLIDYLRGVDNSVYRPRTVKFTDPQSGTVTNDVWKLGDIIDSTPQVQSSINLNGYDSSYGDASYLKFAKSNQYKARNVVYAGSNDGMLHAFRLGTVTTIHDTSNSARVAKMAGKNSDNSDLGQEEWAFIPKNALPYIQHQAGTEYCHQDLVDGVSTVVDASIFKADCSSANYWDCTRKATVGSTGDIDTTKTTWGTVLVGSMGLGGASRDLTGSCNETLNHDSISTNNLDCVKTPVAGNGMSSYFALDVTDPLNPKYMWEFSDYSIATAADKGLGFTTPGPAIVRINALASSGVAKADRTKNGRWFAVFASGPTGAISNLQFSGRSDQHLKIYIVDLNATMPFTKGTNYWVIDTQIPFAFANSVSNASIDLDRWNPQLDGNYSDDVVYITYTKASLDSSGYPVNTRSSAGGYDTPTPWEKGGVLRLVTNHNPDPSTWFTSTLIDNTGPITTSVGRLQDRSSTSLVNSPQKGNLWVYFGEGRFFYPGDDLSPRRKFYGISDPCYKQYQDTTSTYSQYAGDSYQQYAMGTTAASCGAVALGDLVDQTSAIGSLSGKKGWYVQMDAATTGSTASEKSAERVVSDVRAELNGVVYFTTFTPNTDVCTAGGNTSIWAMKYDTGGAPPASSLVGVTPVQTSGGGITLVNLKDVFKLQLGRKLDGSIAVSVGGVLSTLSQSLSGMASKTGAPSIGSNSARRKILHSQER
jgi:type IV pilus assembly protein PilY1